MTRDYLKSRGREKWDIFRFIHVSTDEVYGNLAPSAPSSTEASSYCPSSPYSASKAASNHLINAWHRTYGLPAITTNCSNNFGPFQFPEKLIPHVILNSLRETSLPIYGDGQQIRDWILSRASVDALIHVLQDGTVGEIYNIGARCEVTNIDLVRRICSLLDNKVPRSSGSYDELIQYVVDRPAMIGDIRSIRQRSRTSWDGPKHAFPHALELTVDWYLDNRAWIDSATARSGRSTISRSPFSKGPGNDSNTEALQ